MDSMVDVVVVLWYVEVGIEGGRRGEVKKKEERTTKQKYSLWLLGRYASPKISQPNNAKTRSRSGLCVTREAVTKDQVCVCVYEISVRGSVRGRMSE